MNIDDIIIEDIERSRTDYDEPVEIADGLKFSQKDLDKRIVYYSSNSYLSGSRDKNGKRKPYKQIINDKIELEASRTDIDVADIDLISTDDDNRHATLILEQDFIKEADKINLNDIIQNLNHVYIRYGGVLAKKIETADEMIVEPVSWISSTTDQRDVWADWITEEHEMTLQELQAKESYQNIEEVTDIAEKKKLQTVTVIEAEGYADKSFITESEDDENDLIRVKVYYTNVGGWNILLFKHELKEKIGLVDITTKHGPANSQYKYAARKPFALPGRARGLGYVEEGMDAQIAVNEAAIAESINAAYSGMSLFKTNSEDVENQIINGLESGSAVFLKDGEYFENDTLSEMQNNAHQSIYNNWETNIDKIYGSYEAATGEEGKVTPFRTQALKARQVASTYDYRGEHFNSLVREVVKDWILPFIVKRIKAEHKIQLMLNGSKGRVLQKAIAEHKVFEKNKRNFLEKGQIFDPERYAAELEMESMGMLQKETETVDIPDSFYESLTDNIMVVIGNDLVDTKAQMNALFEIWETTAEGDPNRELVRQKMIELSNGISPLELTSGGVSPGAAGKGGNGEEEEPAIKKEMDSILNTQ